MVFCCLSEYATETLFGGGRVVGYGYFGLEVKCLCEVGAVGMTWRVGFIGSQVIVTSDRPNRRSGGGLNL